MSAPSPTLLGEPCCSRSVGDGALLPHTQPAWTRVRSISGASELAIWDLRGVLDELPAPWGSVDGEHVLCIPDSWLLFCMPKSDFGSGSWERASPTPGADCRSGNFRGTLFMPKSDCRSGDFRGTLFMPKSDGRSGNFRGAALSMPKADGRSGNFWGALSMPKADCRSGDLQRALFMSKSDFGPGGGKSGSVESCLPLERCEDIRKEPICESEPSLGSSTAASS
jgi:hypothetical protein